MTSLWSSSWDLRLLVTLVVVSMNGWLRISKMQARGAALANQSCSVMYFYPNRIVQLVLFITTLECAYTYLSGFFFAVSTWLIDISLLLINKLVSSGTGLVAPICHSSGVSRLISWNVTLLTCYYVFAWCEQAQREFFNLPRSVFQSARGSHKSQHNSTIDFVQGWSCHHSGWGLSLCFSYSWNVCVILCTKSSRRWNCSFRLSG